MSQATAATAQEPAIQSADPAAIPQQKVPTAVYLRVSSDSQADTDRYGLVVQEAACRRYAVQNCLRIDAVFTDIISGASNDRAGLEQLQKASTRFRAVIIYAVDRLARNVPLAYTLLAELQDAGLEVHSACEGPQSLSDETGSLKFGILAVIAAHERQRIQRRMQAGKLEKAKRGHIVGRIYAYGYRNNLPYEPEAQWVRHIFSLARDYGEKAIATKMTALGVPSARGSSRWSNKSIRGILDNPVYKGAWVYKSKLEHVTVPCPPIISPEEWDLVQAARHGRFVHRGREGCRIDTFSLQGRIRCAHCGYALSGFVPRKGPGTGYYHCLHKQKGCVNRRYHNARKIHAAVRSALLSLLQDPQALADAIIVPPPPAKDVVPDIDRLKAQLKRARDGYLAEVFSLEEFAQTRREIEGKIAALEEEASAPPAKPMDVSRAAQQLKAALELGSLFDIARAARALVSVSVDGQIQIELQA
jgi:site-specific DNA recombinase